MLNFEPQHHKHRRKIIITIVVLFLMVSSFYGGVFLSKKTDIDNSLLNENTVFLGKVLNAYEEQSRANAIDDVEFGLFWDVWDALKDRYVDAAKLNDKELFYGALRGMVAAVNDPYTVFMNPAVTQDFNDDLRGAFEGIGAEIGIKSDVLTIISPLTDMPAHQAGLKPGDKILAIDGQDTGGLLIDEAVNKIRGPKGTQVTLLIWRESFDTPRDFVITRNTIIVKSVKWERRDDDIMVITLSHFNSDTESLFERAVRETIEAGSSGVILDLRNNPGGFLETAVAVAGEWVDDGVIVSEEQSDGAKTEHPASGRARLANYPTVVLVNKGSASASEIVAGALKDYGRAKIVGEQTFGKGSVQELVSLADGSSLKVTVAKWLTPGGVDISAAGITPDEVIELTAEDYENDRDPQLDKAIEMLRLSGNVTM